MNFRLGTFWCFCDMLRQNVRLEINCAVLILYFWHQKIVVYDEIYQNSLRKNYKVNVLSPFCHGCVHCQSEAIFLKKPAWNFLLTWKQLYGIMSNGIHLRPETPASRCLFSCPETFATTITVVSSLLCQVFFSANTAIQLYSAPKPLFSPDHFLCITAARCDVMIRRSLWNWKRWRKVHMSKIK